MKPMTGIKPQHMYPSEMGPILFRVAILKKPYGPVFLRGITLPRLGETLVLELSKEEHEQLNLKSNEFRVVKVSYPALRLEPGCTDIGHVAIEFHTDVPILWVEALG